ncbi:O-antigen ligase family protein [Hyphomicrobium sp.]|uniref:O-antigen ligase family protein n=1 Tax=Hyphomicrobium sp. TaxID=82 RepID=UPI003F70C761
MQQLMSRVRRGLTEAAPTRAFLLAAVATFATVLSVAVPRIGPLAIAIFTMSGAAFLAIRDAMQPGAMDRAKVFFLRPEMLFAAWILIACAWSVEPFKSFFEAIFLAVLILHALYLATYIDKIEVEDIASLGRGFLVGFLLAGLFVCYEIWMRQAIVRMILTYFPDMERGLSKHGTIVNGQIVRLNANIGNRSVTVVSLLLAPAILAARLYVKGFARWAIYAGVGACFVVVMVHPNMESQSAQLATVVAIVALAMAYVTPRVSYWFWTAAFSALLFLIIPLALALFAVDVHKNPNVFASARARVIIWDYTAKRSLEKPILGVGTNSTRHLDEERVRQGLVKRQKDAVAAPQTRAHPHNIYLQIWYELGIAGVLAFAALGFALLRKLQLLGQRTYPMGIMHAAVCMTILVPTFGLWQNWFQCAIVGSILTLALFAAPDTKRSTENPQPA